MNHLSIGEVFNYFTQFFDNKFLRDLRPFSYRLKDPFINRLKDGEADRYATNIRIAEETPKEHLSFTKNIQHFGRGFSDVVAELYSCQNIQDFQNKSINTPNKNIDRIFFDFDFDKNLRAKELKKEILVAVTTGNKKSVANQMDEYVNGLLLGEKIALQPYKEMIKLYKYLESFNIKSYPFFSGSKGFHLYILFPATTELSKDSINYLSTRIAETYAQKCDLKTIDFSVNNDAYSRVSRLPYSKHPVTDLYTYPIDINNSYEEIIEKSIKPKMQKFKITDYKQAEGNKELTKQLLTLNKDYMKQKTELNKSKTKANELRIAKKSKKYHGKTFKNQDSIFKDCRILAKEFLGEPVKSYGDYVTYKCPFHNDHNPSMIVNKKRFQCYSCGFIYNYFEFIKRHQGFSTDEEVKKFMRETVKNKIR